MTLGRRTFLLGSAASTAAIAFPGCSSTPVRTGADGGSQSESSPARLDPVHGGILSLASRAPSSHNTQPWRVHVVKPGVWVVGADPARRLPVVDADDRELFLSIGAFIEYVTQAAAAAGLDAEPTIASAPIDLAALAEVRLRPASRRAPSVVTTRIEQRRTLRKGYVDVPLRSEDLASITLALEGQARWLPRDAAGARGLEEAVRASFRQQTQRDAAQMELGRWTRLGRDGTAERDGLTSETMEVGGLARFYMRHFMDDRSVMDQPFRQGGIAATDELSTKGAGWLLLWSQDHSLPSLIDAGRRFARMGLLLRERSIAAHPMSQVLEEAPWQTTLARDLALDGAPQFVVRMGYVRSYGAPVSLRRPVGAFTTVAA